MSGQRYAVALVDIASSRRITAPFVQGTVRPQLAHALAQLSTAEGDRSALSTSVPTPSLSLSPPPRPPLQCVRVCGYSYAAPRLQHASWAASWAAYLQKERDRGPVSARPGDTPDAAALSRLNTPARVAAARAAIGESHALFGPLAALPVPVEAAEGEAAWQAEFFRVDVWVPIHTQILQSVRYLLRTRRPPLLEPPLAERRDAAAPHPMAVIAVVAPEIETETYATQLTRLAEERRHGDTGVEGADVSCMLFHSRSLVQSFVV